MQQVDLALGLLLSPLSGALHLRLGCSCSMPLLRRTHALPALHTNGMYGMTPSTYDSLSSLLLPRTCASLARSPSLDAHTVCDMHPPHLSSLILLYLPHSPPPPAPLLLNLLPQAFIQLIRLLQRLCLPSSFRSLPLTHFLPVILVHASVATVDDMHEALFQQALFPFTHSTQPVPCPATHTSGMPFKSHAHALASCYTHSPPPSMPTHRPKSNKALHIHPV